MQVSIQSPYLHYSLVTEKTRWAQDAVAGVFVSLGAWVNAYTEYDNSFLAEIDHTIFHFHPEQQQYELRLALYLTERCRQLAREGIFEQEISMSELLAGSGSYENGSSFKVVTMEKKTQTSIMHRKRF